MGVKCIRIYYGEYGTTPMADLLMADGVVETIEWTNVRQRNQFKDKINGYTLIYDERPKIPWEEWFHRT